MARAPVDELYEDRSDAASAPVAQLEPSVGDRQEQRLGCARGNLALAQCRQTKLPRKRRSLCPNAGLYPHATLVSGA